LIYIFHGNESYSSDSVIKIINLLIDSLQNKYLFKFFCFCDTFGKLNKLKGPDKNILDLSDKIAAFIKKLLLWKEDIANLLRSSQCFTFLSN